MSNKDNSILLTLPKISFGENESEESERNVSGMGIVVSDGEKAIMVGNHFKGERESEAVTDEDKLFLCNRQLDKTDRLSPELKDVYNLLMQLPNFSQTSWTGFNSSTSSSRRDTAISKASARNLKYLGKTKKNAFSLRKATKFTVDSDFTDGSNFHLNKVRTKKECQCHVDLASKLK